MQIRKYFVRYVMGRFVKGNCGVLVVRSEADKAALAICPFLGAVLFYPGNGEPVLIARPPNNLFTPLQAECAAIPVTEFALPPVHAVPLRIFHLTQRLKAATTAL